MADPVIRGSSHGDTPAGDGHDGAPAGDAQAGAPVEPVTVTPSPDAVEVLPAPHQAEDEFVAAAAAHEERFTLLLNREPAHRRKFLAASIAVGAIAAAALVGLVLSLSSSPKKSTPFAQGAAPGSKAFDSVGPTGGWHPICDVEFGCDRPHQIAAYVAPKYVLADGKDAVAIISGSPTIANGDGSVSPVGAIIERNDRGSRIVYTDSNGDNTVQYSLCGFAASCALTGTPSVARGDLLRRQALELALLTFKYDTSVKSTLVFFPKPVKSTDTAYVLFFRRADYGALLARPLADTLGKQVVLKPSGVTEAMAQKIGDITAPRVFKYEYRQTQQGLPVLVLTPAAY